MVTVSSQSFANSSRAGIVDQQVQFAQILTHLAESVAQSGSSRLQSSMKFVRRY